MRFNLLDYEVSEFEFEGRKIKLICPEKPVGKLAFKMEYWGAFPDAEANLIDRGYHLVHMANEGSRFLDRKDFDVKARLVKFLSEKYNLDGKCVPVGMSLGGAQAILFASFYPELVSCMFLDAPVIDYSSMRYITKDNSVWENEVLKTYPKLRRYQAPGFEENPVNRLKIVVDNKIPIFMSYGLEDATVPYDFNGALLEDAYDGTDLLTVYPIPCRGHHPHGLLYDSAEIVDFIIANS